MVRGILIASAEARAPVGARGVGRVHAMVVPARHGVSGDLGADLRRQRAFHGERNRSRDHLRHHRPLRPAHVAGRFDLKDRHAGIGLDGEAPVHVVLVDRVARAVGLELDREEISAAIRGGVGEPVSCRLRGGQGHGVRPQHRHVAGVGEKDLRDHAGIEVARNLAGFDPADRLRDPRLRHVQGLRAALVHARDLRVHDRGRHQSGRDDDEHQHHEQRDDERGPALVRLRDDVHGFLSLAPPVRALVTE